MVKFLLYILIFNSALYGIENPLIEELYNGYFSSFPKESISIEPLKGGYEAISYKIEAGNKKYVLRIFPAHQSSEVTEREIWAMQEFAKIGISPTVYYISPQNQAILMDFIEGNTSTLSEAKKNLNAMAKTLRTIHSTDKHPVPSDGAFLKRSKEFYRQIKERCQGDPDSDRAIKFIQDNSVALSISPKANLHGDLIPHNIFFKSDGVKLIDWTYTRWDDPFYDLSYFALFHAYSEDEEQHLLVSYLERLPSQEEINRYQLTKKMNLASLYLNIYNYVLEQLEEDPTQEIDTSASLQPWNYYVEQFGVKEASFPLQFFYEWAKSASI